MKKNDEYVITIDDIGNEGEGIGHIYEDAAGGDTRGVAVFGKDVDAHGISVNEKSADVEDTRGIAVFVKDAVVGDVVRVGLTKVKKNYAYARVIEVIEPSRFRVQPICVNARKCGGCNLMHMSYEKQLEYKWNKVRNCLERIGGIRNVADIMEPIIGMDSPVRYRNKAQFPVRQDRNGKINIGFYAGRTHDVIDTDICYIQDEKNDKIIECIRAFMEKYKVEPYDEEHHSGLIRHILTRVGRKTGEVMVCLVINGKALVGACGDKFKKYRDVEAEFVQCLQEIDGITSISLNINTDKTNRILGDSVRTIWGSDTISDYIGNVKYQISPLSFYQVNPIQTEKLYSKALEYANLQGNEVVWDLYCGIGTISLFLAQRAKKVLGVEIVPQAIEDARKNATLNGFDNTEFFVGKAEEVLPEQFEKKGIHPDVIVVDPPRKGCDIVAIETMLKMAPQRIVYVSCDPATLARDVKLLCDGGYELKRVCPTDMFPNTGHVEVVTCLQRVNS